jgi:hydrogenase maturation protease
MVRLVDGEVPVFLQQRISPHQLGLSDLLAMLTLVEQAPRHLVLLGIVPESLELSLALSPLIEPKVALLVDQVVAELEPLGYRLAARVGDDNEVRV